jgi:hypothetical protein
LVLDGGSILQPVYNGVSILVLSEAAAQAMRDQCPAAVDAALKTVIFVDEVNNRSISVRLQERAQQTFSNWPEPASDADRVRSRDPTYLTSDG